MSLSPGTRLGPYEIVAPIGAGGMGEVYRAKDTKLNRDVAIKVLPESFALDADRVARFTREAQVLASLNHPNIAAIYGIEESGNTRALVMELVAGEDLSAPIARGAMPLADALPIARQIADALEAAHEQGIVHRDLKPANIKVRADGTVKVLDFGLAKAMDPADAASGTAMNSPTLTARMTQMGIILGTAAYMAPEQAKGKTVDRRADIWAFGVVLHEMLTGQHLFMAETIPETLAHVMTRQIDLGTMPASTPRRVRDLLARCLEKDPKQRLRDIGEARVILEDPALLEPAVAAPTTTIAPRQPMWRRAAPIVAAAVVTAIVAGLAAWTLKPSDAVPGSPTRFPMILPDDLRFIRGTSGQMLAISPDGTRVVYVGNGQLFLRSMSDMDARPIPGSSGLDPTHPFFSPDGQWVGFAAIGDLTVKKVAVGGGAPITLWKLPGIGNGSFDNPRWDGDEILFAQPGQGIMRLSANGGEPQVLIRIDGPAIASGPQLLPGGKSVLFSLATGQGADRWDTAQIVVQSLTSSERKIVLRGARAAQYVPTGHLVYALGTTLMAIPFDLAKLEVRGGPVSILEGVRPSAVPESGAAAFALSTTGSLVYVPGSSSASSPQTLALADRSGKVQPLGLPPQPYYHPRISPNGKQMVFGTDDGKESIVWVADLKAGASVRRLTFGGKNKYPIWSRDGRFITFQSDREGDHGLFRQPADGSGTAERLTKSENGVQHRPEDWSPDGKTLVLLVSAGSGDLWTLSLDGDRKLKPLVQLPSNERYASFSPDGRWFAYTSDEIGKRFEVFVQPFPTTGAKYQISTDGGRDPLWSPDGKQILYNAVFVDASNFSTTSTTGAAAGKLAAVDVRTQPAFSFGRPTPIPIERAILGGNGRYYDITPDGKRFLVVMPPDAQTAAARPPAERINVVLNWFEELKQRVPVKK